MEPEYKFSEDVSPSSYFPPGEPGKTLSPGRLGRRRRQMILFISLMGLASFTLPLIKTDSPVLGRTQWSPLQIAIELHEGKLPGCDGPIGCDPGWSLVSFILAVAMGGFGIAYGLMLAIAAATLLFPSAEFVIFAAGGGIVAMLAEGRSRFFDLQEFLYGPYDFAGQQVHAKALGLSLLGAFALLAWIGTTKALD